MATNPDTTFLNEVPGPGGTTLFAPAPLFGEDGLSPGVQQAGQAIGESIAEAGAQFLGQKGFLNSSFLPVLTERAFATGQAQALQAAQQQQSLFNQWAMLQNQISFEAGAGEQESSFFEKMGSGALAGAGIGSVFGLEGVGLGAGIGAGVGLLDSFLNLDIF